MVRIRVRVVRARARVRFSSWSASTLGSIAISMSIFACGQG